MISLIPSGVDVPWDGLINGTLTNRDGHGWAVAAGDTLVVGKSMKAEEALEQFEEARNTAGRSSLALFHSRIGTHGSRTVANVHPFYVGEEQTTVVAHNGILPLPYRPAPKDDDRSDTRVFADMHARDVNNAQGLPSRRISQRIAQQIGVANKLVFLSVRSGKPRARIINPNAGCFSGGVWFSNHGFEDRPRPTYARAADRDYRYYGSNYAWDDDDFWRNYDRNHAIATPTPRGTTVVRYQEPGKGTVYRSCPKCHTFGQVTVTHECLACNTCLDCKAPLSKCLCYNGEPNPYRDNVALNQQCPSCKGYDVDETDFEDEKFMWCNDCRQAWTYTPKGGVRLW